MSEQRAQMLLIHRWRPWHWYLRHPWRYSPIRQWLIAHSRLYRRFMMWQFKRSMLRMERVIGKKLVPAMNQAAESMRKWMEEAERV